MKSIFIVIGAAFSTLIANGQLTEGKIIYERTMQLQIQIADDNPAFQHKIPKERKDRFELLFTEGKSLWLPSEDDTQSDELNFSDGGGARIVVKMPGSDDIAFHNIQGSIKVEKKSWVAKHLL